MSCISHLLGKSFSEVFNGEKKSVLRKLKPEGSASRDSLALEKDVARKAEYERLKKLNPPKMGLPERVMCTVRDMKTKVRGEGDIIPFVRNGKNVRLKNFAQLDHRTIEQGGIFRGAMPSCGEDYEKLAKKYNIRHIIDLRGFETTPVEYINDFAKGWAEFHGIPNYHHIPLSSNEEPTKELPEIFRIIEEAQRNGEGVYIHCKHGIDRTGSVCAAIEEHLGISKGAYDRMQRHGYNLQHERTKPAQKAFVTGPDFAAKVQAAEKLKLDKQAQELAESGQMPAERHASVKRHLKHDRLPEARERVRNAQRTLSGTHAGSADEPLDWADEINQALTQKNAGYYLHKSIKERSIPTDSSTQSTKNTKDWFSSVPQPHFSDEPSSFGDDMAAWINSYGK